MLKHCKTLIIILPALVFISGCTIKVGQRKFSYSFNGAFFGTAKTASVQYFENRAAMVQPTLALKLTDKLKDKIESQSPLKIVNGSNGDVNFEGSIERYYTEPTAVSGGETATATLNRLTLTIQVKYTNSTDPTFEYDTQFTRYVDYHSDMSLEQAESENLDGLVDLLVEDIFNKAFVNW